MTPSISAWAQDRNEWRWRRVQSSLPTRTAVYVVIVDAMRHGALEVHATQCLAWYVVDQGWSMQLGYPAEVTHWMPLPPAPERLQ